MTITLSLSRQKQEDREFKVILEHTESVRPGQATDSTASNKAVGKWEFKLRVLAQACNPSLERLGRKTRSSRSLSQKINHHHKEGEKTTSKYKVKPASPAHPNVLETEAGGPLWVQGHPGWA